MSTAFGYSSTVSWPKLFYKLSLLAEIWSDLAILGGCTDGLHTMKTYVALYQEGSSHLTGGRLRVAEPGRAKKDVPDGQQSSNSH